MAATLRAQPERKPVGGPTKRLGSSSGRNRVGGGRYGLLARTVGPGGGGGGRYELLTAVTKSRGATHLVRPRTSSSRALASSGT